MTKKIPPSKTERPLTTLSSIDSGTRNSHGVLRSHGRRLRFSDIASIFCSTSNRTQFLSSIARSRAELAFLVEFSVTRACLNLQRRFLRSVRVRSSVVRTYSRKRKRLISYMEDCSCSARKRCFLLDLNEEENATQMVMSVPGGVQNDLEMISSVSSLSTLSEYDFLKLEKPLLTHIMSTKSAPSLGQIGFRKRKFGQRSDDPEVGCSREELYHLHGTTGCQSVVLFQDKFPHPLETIVEEEMLESPHHPKISMIYSSELGRAEETDDANCTVTRDRCDSSILEIDKKIRVSRAEVGAFSQSFESLTEDVNEKRKEVYTYGLLNRKSHLESQQLNTTQTERSQSGDNKKNFIEHFDLNLIPVDTGTECHFVIQGSIQTQLEGSSSPHKDELIEIGKICSTMGKNKGLPYPVGSQKVDKDKELIQVKRKIMDFQNVNPKQNIETHVEKSKKTSTSKSKDGTQKPYPDFESFVVEEEEGSGGYGTVYRAKRKADGVTFAIKYPHANANRSHVQNELKMLERLGGKNFVIKYEGSFKHGNADCLVLEHVDHDRPEVLKREINIFQLKWYGYCLFHALAKLHSKNIAHRDVKPGNFLFSRKTNKGYLIDFNLALDYRKKHATFDNVKDDLRRKYDHFPTPGPKASEKNRKPATTRFPVTGHKNTGKVVKLPTGDLPKKADKANAFIKSSSMDITKSQGADGSAVTSVKESTKTKAGGKFREPLPSQGRKELLSLAQEALHGVNQEHTSVSANTSKRKRVEALRSHEEVYKKVFYPTPMPLHGSIGAHLGPLKSYIFSSRDGKQRRDGPCVGTKGFKAPEVLLKSLHQGPKADIWSAGATLLYLIVGRTPFPGDTDVSIREIVKLRGSEDLWELAKLHNQESSFPKDLLHVKYLLPGNLRLWCDSNTRRPDFYKAIPKSLFDLLDKCLTVNPRCRISAEEALRHEFFAPCLDYDRKHRQGQ